MKYTSFQINSMSWKAWCNLMVDELNKAGFKERGYNEETRQWQNDYVPFKEVDDPTWFVLGTLTKGKELEYLKSLGLLNNGRCPMCGNRIDGNPGRFTSGYDSSFHFQVCQSCVSKGKRNSLNPANNTGCIVALLLLPWYMIKALISHI